MAGEEGAVCEIQYDGDDCDVGIMKCDDDKDDKQYMLYQQLGNNDIHIPCLLLLQLAHRILEYKQSREIPRSLNCFYFLMGHTLHNQY